MAKYLLREFTMNSLSFSRIHYQFTIFLAHSLWLHWFFAYSTWIYYFFRESTITSLSNRELTMNPLIFCVLTLNFLSISRIHYGSFLFLAYSLWIHYLFDELSPSRIHYEFLIFFIHYQFFFIHYQFTIFLANSLWLH